MRLALADGTAPVTARDIARLHRRAAQVPRAGHARPAAGRPGGEPARQGRRVRHRPRPGDRELRRRDRPHRGRRAIPRARRPPGSNGGKGRMRGGDQAESWSRQSGARCASAPAPSSDRRPSPTPPPGPPRPPCTTSDRRRGDMSDRRHQGHAGLRDPRPARGPGAGPDHQRARRADLPDDVLRVRRRRPCRQPVRSARVRQHLHAHHEPDQRRLREAGRGARGRRRGARLRLRLRPP